MESSFTVLSAEAEIGTAPAIATPTIGPVCPAKFCISFPSATVHNRSELSAAPDSTCMPSALNATAVTAPW